MLFLRLCWYNHNLLRSGFFLVAVIFVWPSEQSFLSKSATICYMAELLKSRAVADKFSADIAGRHGLSGSEMTAVEAIHCAVEFNPPVVPYLLQMRSINLVRF